MKKVLMIASQEIVNDLSDGGKRVSNRNWKLLLDMFGKDNVTLVIFDRNISTNKEDNLNINIQRIKPFSCLLDRALNILIGNFFADEKCNKAIVNLIKEYEFELVFIDRSIFGNLAIKIKEITSATLWVFSHNFEAEYFANKFRKNRILSWAISKIAKNSEKKTILAADLFFTLTKRDSESSLKYYGREADAIIPTSFEDRYDESKYINNLETGINTLLFIGSNFNANYDGIKWFVDTVMPELPDYKLLIIGKGFEQSKEELTRKNVCVVGYVSDLEQYYYNNNVIVMPIFYGAGQKVKTAEAMMYGKTILATDEALEGYDVDGVDGIVRCNNCKEFIGAIKNLGSDNVRENRYCIRQLFLEKYSYSGVLQAVETLLE